MDICVTFVYTTDLYLMISKYLISDLPVVEKRDYKDDPKGCSVRYANYIALILETCTLLALFVIFYTVDSVYLEDVLKIIFLAIPPVMILWYVNYKRHYFVCGLFINLSLTILFFILTGIFFGKAAGLHYYFLLFSLVPLFSFKSERHILMAVLMALNLFCFIYVDLLKPDGEMLLTFPESLIGSFRVATIAIIFFVMALIVGINQYVLRYNEKKLERQAEEISRQHEELANLIQSKERFFSIIVQDLKGPVGTLSSFLDYLADFSNNLTTKQLQESLEALKNSSRDIYDLFVNLLTWSRIQYGNIDFYRQEHNLTELINSTVNNFSPQIKKKDIKIVNLINNRNFLIPFDKEMINAVLSNIMNNAIKFSNERGEIVISIKESEDFLELSIADNGVGMEKKILDNLFRIDVKQNTHLGTHGERGTGLGLILCKEFIERHGGEIHIESEAGKGCRSKFSLPLKG